MKFIKKINLKLISIFLVAIFCASTTLTSVTTTAATTSNSVATTIISDVVKAYANNVSKTIASIPYIGTGLQPIFNFLFGELMSELSAKKGDSSKEIQAKLNQIQKTLSDVSIKQQLSENKSFEDAVNSLNVKCDEAIEIQKFIVKNQDYINEINSKAEKTEQELKELKEFEKNKENLNSCVTDKAFVELIAKIENNITGKEIGRDKDPFTNYFEAQNKELKFTSDAFKKSRSYQEAILQVYLTAVTLNMGALGKSYDLAVSQKEVLKSSSIEEKLKMATNNCQETLEAYNKIVQNEEQAENRYYYDKDNYITIGGVGRVKVKNSQFYSIGNLYQPDILDYIDKGPYLAYKNFDNYFKNINDMIANEYTDTEKYTLRTFLESKGFNIPSEARYLIAGNTKVEARNYAIYKIPLYDLDKATNKIEDYKYYSYTGGYLGGGRTYYNNDKLCYFLDKATSTSDCLAALSDTNEGETVYFDDISDAWSTAIKWCKNGKKVKIKLNDDWIATKYADGTTSFGNGVGFKNGAIWTDCGKANIYLYMDQITLDLNGHKIDRNLTKSIKDGSVIIVERTPLKIIDSSGTNNGLITGGNTTEDGGGIKVCEWASVTVENCKITNNKAQGYGGGVSLYNLKILVTRDAGYFYNSEIVNNTSPYDKGKDIYAQIWGTAAADVTVGGKVKIGDCLLEVGFWSKNIIHIDQNRPLTSDSSIGIYSNWPGSSRKITSYNNKNYKNCFHSNLNGYKIINSGSGSSQYLYIAKNDYKE